MYNNVAVYIYIYSTQIICWYLDTPYIYHLQLRSTLLIAPDCKYFVSVDKCKFMKIFLQTTHIYSSNDTTYKVGQEKF